MAQALFCILLYRSLCTKSSALCIKKRCFYVLPFFHACSGIAPTFQSLGNHEQMLDEEDLQAIEQTGVTILDNTYTTITVDGEDVAIGGLTSAYVTDYRRAEEGIRSAGNRYPKKAHFRAEPNVIVFP